LGGGGKKAISVWDEQAAGARGEPSISSGFSKREKVLQERKREVKELLGKR